VAQRQGLRLLAGIKPQQQDQWAAAAKLPHTQACLIYRLIKNGQGYEEPDLHTYELKYKDQILNSLRRRANSFGFDLVEVPKAA
jgi:hypothetical protein